jgi:DNA-binding transcriptional ArsR family regulator
MGGDQAVAALARVLAHKTCLRLIDALAAGEATVSDLSSRLQLDQPRVSTHLGLMREVGLVDCRAAGRQRVYSLRGEAARTAVAALRALAAGLGEPRPAAPEPADVSPIRRARTCYDHLAGIAGVQLRDDLLARGWIEPAEERAVRLTEAGAAALARLGVRAAPPAGSRRAPAIDCLDWTERRPHVGGALGAALLNAMLEQGRVRRLPAGRAVDLAPGEPAAFLESAGG